MRDDATRVRFFNILVGILIGAMITGLAGTAILIGYHQVKDYLDFAASATYVFLLLIGLPLSVFLYYSRRDQVLKQIMLGLALTYSIYTLSCLLSIVSLLDPALVWLYNVSQPILLMAYLPTIYVLVRLLAQGKAKPPEKVISRYIEFIGLAAVLAICLYYLKDLPGLSGDPMVLLDAGYAVMDAALLTVSALLVLAYMPTQHRYAFAYIFFCVSLSFGGDMAYIITSLSGYDLGLCAELLYMLTLIFSALGLLKLALTNIRPTTVEEVDKKLSDTRLQMADIIVQSPDGMAVFDSSGDLLRANAVFDGLFGTAPGNDNAGLFNIFRLMRSREAGLADQISSLQAGATVQREELEMPPPPAPEPGSPRYISFKVFPTLASDQTTSGYVAVVQDITVRKQGELALKAANEELEKRVTERTAQLETTNEALQLEVEARKADEERIKASLYEKEVLLKEIHHRVKNNMQIVSSLLSLQSSSARDPAMIAMNQDSQNRIRSMALIHEKLYQSHSLSRIDFGEYVKSLTGYILGTYNARSNVRVTVDIVNVWLEIDTAIPCGLIVNELFSNCLKHAFSGRERGEVLISMAVEGDQYILRVKDDGTGLTAGYDPATATTLGLSLVSALAGQLEGEVEVRSENGTEFTVRFPVSTVLGEK